MPIPFLFFPQELQLQILNTLDISTLAAVCRTSRSLLAKAESILWHDIDIEGDEDAHCRFLYACDRLMESRSARWQTLAAQVRSLRIGRISGIGIPDDIHNSDGKFNDSKFGMRFGARQPSKRTLYDIIASFTALEELSLFIQEPWDLLTGESNAELAQRMHFAKLRKLQVGGCIPEEMMLGLISSPETIEELSCVALQGTSASQEAPPEPLLFFESVQDRLTNLKVLHLCKLGELFDDVDNEMGLPGEFSRDDDCAVLREWADLIQQVSKFLVNLTLENCYLVDSHKLEYLNRRIDPKEGDDGDPVDWGRISNSRFREILVPVLAEQAWENLQRLKLIGLDRYDEAVKNEDPLAHLQPRINIEYEQGGVLHFNYEVTPMVISPPSGLWGED